MPRIESAWVNERPVREERSRWRDLALCDRHRQWGWNCPAVDVDLLFLEYDSGKSVALVEYKHELAAPAKLGHPSYQALIDLGNRAGLPTYVVRYADDFSWWKAQPLNDHAKRWLSGSAVLTEAQWVELLYRMRGRALPEGWAKTVSQEL
jgi:hypothetical protein